MNFDKIMKVGFETEQLKTKNKRITFDGHRVRVGASDVAGCPRKTAYQLINEDKTTLSEYFRMRKGNVAEGVVEGNLREAGVQFEKQGEYLGEGIFDFILVHPDILINLGILEYMDIQDNDIKKDLMQDVKDGYKYVLIELKTTNNLPSEPHDYWVKQSSLQAEYIAREKDIDISEIKIVVYAMELNDGLTKQFDIEYDAEATTLIQEDALQLAEFMEEYIRYANMEVEEMQVTINDVNRNVGPLCSICKFAPECIGGSEVVQLPKELEDIAVYVKNFKAEEKNVKKSQDELRKFMLQSGAKRAEGSDAEVMITGGKKSEVVDETKLTKEEILELAEKHPDIIKFDSKKLNTLAKKFDFLDKKKTEKVSPIRMRIM